MSAGTLHLIPAPLADVDVPATYAPAVLQRIRALDFFIVEAPKTARAFLRQAEHPVPIAALRIEPVPQDDGAADVLLQPILEGRSAALLSEAGAPAVADPGAKVVRRAHALGIRVVPEVGPSAILLALMASGLEGQRFVFHGYLPVEEAELARRLKELENASRRERQTQIFIETPYRNDRLVRVLLAHCAPSTLVCIASNLTAPDETVATRSVATWRRAVPQIGKRPTVFLLLGGASA